MGRGRKPKPTEAKRAAGNPGKRDLGEPIEISPALPEAPEWLDEVARAEWDRIGPILETARIVTEADRSVLASYCAAYSDWVAARKQLEEHGTVEINDKGVAYQSPYFNVMQSAQKQMMQAAAELGLSPSSRSKVKPLPKDESNEKSRFFQ